MHPASLVPLKYEKIPEHMHPTTMFIHIDYEWFKGDSGACAPSFIHFYYCFLLILYSINEYSHGRKNNKNE